jgi:hypothetical protein
MKKQLVILGTITLLVCVGLSGCSSRDGRFIGTWRSSLEAGSLTNTFTLYSDGRCDNQPTYTANLFHMSDNWDVKNNRLVFNFVGTNEILLSYSYSFSNNDNTLTLVDSNGNTLIYNKQ